MHFYWFYYWMNLFNSNIFPRRTPNPGIAIHQRQRFQSNHIFKQKKGVKNVSICPDGRARRNASSENLRKNYEFCEFNNFSFFKRELKLLAILHLSVSCCSFTICQNVIMPKLVGASFTSWVKENEVQGIFSRLFFWHLSGCQFNS